MCISAFSCARKSPCPNAESLPSALVRTVHFCSIVDVALGSLRFAINAFATQHERQLESTPALLALLSPLMYRDTAGTTVHEIGFWLSPENVKSDAYRAQYVALAKFFADHGLALGQASTGWAPQ